MAPFGQKCVQHFMRGSFAARLRQGPAIPRETEFGTEGQWTRRNRDWPERPHVRHKRSRHPALPQARPAIPRCQPPHHAAVGGFAPLNALRPRPLRQGPIPRIGEAVAGFFVRPNTPDGMRLMKLMQHAHGVSLANHQRLTSPGQTLA